MTLHLCATVPRLLAGAELILNMISEDSAAVPIDIGPEATVPDDPGVGWDLPDSHGQPPYLLTPLDRGCFPFQ